MARFIAIPVAQGDAFYLRRNEWSVLVDGGRSRAGFPRMFRKFAKTDGVSVLVCTHNDADHANGILGFLESDLQCEEVWLPGRWLTVIPDLLEPLVKVTDVLTADIANARSKLKPGAQLADFSSIEKYAGSLSDRMDGESAPRDRLHTEQDGWPRSCVALLDRAVSWDAGPWPDSLSRADWRRHVRYGWNVPSEKQPLWSAIDAANRIRSIAIAAFHRGIPVRWFEFAPNAPLCGTPALQPVNAREIFRARQRGGRLLDFVALTVSNRESLVFWSPKSAQHPGVLFTADSDLSGVGVPSALRGALITAPHHGSDANRDAYEAVKSKAPQDISSTTWIRSDGRYRTRPGEVYLALSSRRICTMCRGAAEIFTRKQAVCLYSRTGSWTPYKASALCSCR